jgi:hypothetical protein
MRQTPHVPSLLGIAGAALLALAGAAPARAFDTGHHQDMTRSALARAGFGDTAIQVVQLENWLVDFYAVHPLVTFHNLGAINPDRTMVAMQHDLEKLHFDNLFTTEQVRDYWNLLLLNTRCAFQVAAGQPPAARCDQVGGLTGPRFKQLAPSERVLTALTLLGMSLHAVQDFYSHSNWVESEALPAVGEIQPRTWFAAEAAGGAHQAIFTGFYPWVGGTPPLPPSPALVNFREHDDTVAGGVGLNKDAYARKGWEDAYIHAYLASREWLADVERVVGPDFWRCMKTFTVAGGDLADLQRDQAAAFELSLRSGHWKGAGTASNPQLAVAYEVWGQDNSRFVRQFRDKRIYQWLVRGLYDPAVKAPSPSPAVMPLPLDEQAIVLHTTSLEVPGEPAGVVFRAIIGAGRPGTAATQFQLFQETHQQALQRSWPWRTIYFAPRDAPEIAFHYVLLREPELTGLFDQQLDINPLPQKLDLDFTFLPASAGCQGEVLKCSLLDPAQLSGDGALAPSAAVGFYLISRPPPPK